MNRAQLEQASRAAATWYPIDDRLIVARVLGDTKLVVDRQDLSLTPHLVMDGFWESWITIWAMSQCMAADRVLNIGANCGYYTMLFARRAARVVAVEPQPVLARAIGLSAALNGFGAKVQVRSVVAGVEERTVKLQLHRDFAGSAFVGEALDGEKAQDWLREPLVTREVPAHELMPGATCAFIDAEGYEPQIWEGLKPLLQKRQLRWVALEWAPSRYEDPERFLGQLSDYGRLSTVQDQGQEVPANPTTLLRGTEWDTLVVRAR